MVPDSDLQTESTALFTHPALNEPVTAIGGSYVITGEQEIAFRGERLLVFSGHAVFDTSCCGAGGCAYALVPGFVDSYRCRKDAAGRWLSMVRPIRDPHLKRSVSAAILSRASVQQVQFI